MNKFAKFAAVAAVFLAVLLIVLIVLVKALVTPERVKAAVIPLAERALQRQVSLGQVKVGLFSGIELRDLAIGEPGEAEPFIAAGKVVLRFQLLPLLVRKVVIDEVALEGPTIRVIRRGDGSYSVSDLAAPATDAGPSAGGGDGEKPFDLLVTTARIRDGRLVFLDRQLATVTELSDLRVDANGIALDGAVPVKLSAALQGAPLQAEGVVRPLQKEGILRVAVQGLNVAALAPYYRDRVPGTLGRLLLDLQGEFSLQGGALSARGSLHGRDLDLTLTELPAAPLQNARVTADYDLALDPARDRLVIAALSIDCNGLAAQLSGEIAGLATAPQGNLRLTIPGLDLSLLKTALPAPLLGPLAPLDLAGTLQATASLNGALDRPLAMLRDGEVVLAGVQATATGVRAQIDARLALTGDSARIDAMTIGVGEVKARVDGRVDRLLTAPAADLTVVVPRVDLARALAGVPQAELKGLAGLAPGGQVEARARLAGPLADPKGLLRSAELRLDDVQFNAGGQRPAFDGQLLIAGDQLGSKGLVVRLAGNSARLDITASNLFGKPLIARVDVTAQRFLFEPVVQGAAATATSATATTATTSPPAGTVGPFDLPVQASGTLRLGETAWKGLTIRDMQAEYALRDNQLTIGRMTGRVAEGSFVNTARIDLRRAGLGYAATLEVQGVQVEPLLAAFAPQAAGTLTGTLAMQGSFDAAGTEWQTISRTLSGDGLFSFADGRLVSPALVSGLAAFLQLPGLDTIDFRDFRGKVRVTNGRAEIDSSLSGLQFRLYPRGSLGLDGSLDLAMDTRLSPDVTARLDRRGQVARFLADAEGWSQVPLLIGGTLQSPRFALDPKGVQAQATRALQQELQRGLDKLLKPAPSPSREAAPAGDSPAEPPPPASPAPAPARKFLEETLQRTLGR